MLAIGQSVYVVPLGNRIQGHISDSNTGKKREILWQVCDWRHYPGGGRGGG